MRGGCIAPALLFFRVGLLKGPRAPCQEGEVIYLRLEKNVLYYTASEMLGLSNCQTFTLTWTAKVSTGQSRWLRLYSVPL